MKKIEDMTAEEIVKNKIHPTNPRDRLIATNKVCKAGIKQINDLLAKWDAEEKEKNRKKWWEFWK